jgi:hypothetical protein
MAKKGSLWIEGENILDFKSKKVELNTNIDKTKTIWSEFINNEFNDPNFKIYDTSKFEKSIDIEIEPGLVRLALSKCKLSASPGTSKIGLKLISKLFEEDELFITSVLQDIINNKCDTSIFSCMEVIPIYKTNKGMDPSLPNA